MPVWKKKGHSKINEKILKYEVGSDMYTDVHFLKEEVLATISHATMLAEVGEITSKELESIKNTLSDLLKGAGQKGITISYDEEDIHSKVENFLTDKLGDLGKKIHTARSRNDQVATLVKLFTRSKTIELMEALINFADALVSLEHKHLNTFFIGYTHSRQAMPTSTAHWIDSFVDCIFDDLKYAEFLIDFFSCCPLGTAAGYGVPFKINRETTARVLRFKKPCENSLAVQNSRGKYEAFFMQLLSSVMLDLSHFSEDLIFFSSDEVKFVELPRDICTGSSIMPHKQNPDVLELLRARARKVAVDMLYIWTVPIGLPSGYNRDYQELKKPLIESFKATLESVEIMSIVASSVKFNKDRILELASKYLFATDEVYKLVRSGMPFREAYRAVGEAILRGEFEVDKVRTAKEIFSSGRSFGSFISVNPSKRSAEIKEWRGKVERLKREFHTDSILKELMGEGKE